MKIIEERVGLRVDFRFNSLNDKRKDARSVVDNTRIVSILYTWCLIVDKGIITAETRIFKIYTTFANNVGN